MKDMTRQGLTWMLAISLAVPTAARAQEHRPPAQDTAAAEMRGGAAHGGMGGRSMMGPQGMGMMGTMGGMGRMGMMGMMRMMGSPGAPDPAWVLWQKAALDLTPEQIERLEALRQQLARAREAHMKEVAPLHRQAMDALRSERPDWAAYEATLRKIAEHHVALQVEAARLGQRVLEILTPEQRSNVRYGCRLAQTMMMRRGGAMHGSGMHGGMSGEGGMGGPMMGPMPCPVMEGTER